MADVPVFVDVSYLDAAEKTAVVSYRLERAYNTTTPNWAAVYADAGDLITALSALTWAQISGWEVRVSGDSTTASANIAANNQVRAFTRCLDSDGEKCSFEVVAWDDDTFDQNDQNLLSGAYDLLAADVAALLANHETGASMTSVKWTQSRTRKSRNVLS